MLCLMKRVSADSLCQRQPEMQVIWDVHQDGCTLKVAFLWCGEYRYCVRVPRVNFALAAEDVLHAQVYGGAQQYSFYKAGDHA